MQSVFAAASHGYVRHSGAASDMEDDCMAGHVPAPRRDTLPRFEQQLHAACQMCLDRQVHHALSASQQRERTLSADLLLTRSLPELSKTATYEPRPSKRSLTVTSLGSPRNTLLSRSCMRDAAALPSRVLASGAMQTWSQGHVA